MSVHVRLTFFVKDIIKKQNHIIKRDTNPFQGAKSATKNIK